MIGPPSGVFNILRTHILFVGKKNYSAAFFPISQGSIFKPKFGSSSTEFNYHKIRLVGSKLFYLTFKFLENVTFYKKVPETTVPNAPKKQKTRKVSYFERFMLFLYSFAGMSYRIVLQQINHLFCILF